MTGSLVHQRNVAYPKVSRFCEHFITPAEMGSDDEWAGTYCKLPSGHVGQHSALYADEQRQEEAHGA